MVIDGNRLILIIGKKILFKKNSKSQLSPKKYARTVARIASTYTAANLDTTTDYKTSILACLMDEIRSIKDQRVAYLKPLFFFFHGINFRILRHNASSFKNTTAKYI